MSDSVAVQPDTAPQQLPRRRPLRARWRQLLAPKVANDVCATLNRLPDREEWREVWLLLFWFGLILLSDVLAVQVNDQARNWGFGGLPQTLDVNQQIVFWTAWFVQGVARAGFFATFAYSLHRAWTLGLGVMIARILQLKLIHTVLVVVAGLTIGHLLETYSSGGFQAYEYYSALPPLFTAQIVSGAIVLVAAALMWLPGLRWWALGLALLGAFLYSGGPVASQRHSSERQYVIGTVLELSDGTLVQERYYFPEARSYRGLTIAQRHEPSEPIIRALATQDGVTNLDVARNRLINQQEEVVRELPWHIKGWYDARTYLGQQYEAMRVKREQITELTPVGEPRLQGPVVAPGAGLGWLAAPIPLLGLIGLVLLVVVMGQRGPAQLLLYSLLAGAALIATITPFMVGQPISQMFDFNALGLVHTPFPGFEDLMVIPLDELISSTFSMTLIAGLLLSAGVPWLLTSLFLRPTKSP